MNSFLNQFAIALVIIIINMVVLCFKFIDWNWNLTAWIRILAPLFLFTFLHPAVAMLLVDGLLDSIEPNISRENIEYHLRDKKLDLWGHFVGLIASWIIPSMKPYRTLLTGLFIFRTIGVFNFLTNKNKKYLAYFPNYYSMFYILLPFLDNSYIVKTFNMKLYRTPIIILFLITKTIIEYFHHYSKKKKKILGLRSHMKYFCKGKQEMYKQTGTFPVNKKRINEKAPIFK